MQKSIMAIGGHIGDAELTSGGVLAEYALRGYKIVTVALTGGERGNPKGMSVEEYRIQKEKEANEFAEKLGGEAVVLPYVDGELPDNDDVRFTVCDLIRRYKPEAVMTHWKHSMHKDHELTHKIVRDAIFWAGLPGMERENPAHFAKGPYYAQNWEDSPEFNPYVYVKISKEAYDMWLEAIKIHWFAVNSPSFHYMEYYASLMKCNGYLARAEYAEAFDIDPEQKKVVTDNF